MSRYYCDCPADPKTGGDPHDRKACALEQVRHLRRRYANPDWSGVAMYFAAAFALMFVLLCLYFA